MGLDFTVYIREDHVFAKGGNNYGQLGCGDTEKHEEEEYVQGLQYPVRSVYTGLACCYAVIKQ